jgi:hypothetical protein
VRAGLGLVIVLAVCDMPERDRAVYIVVHINDGSVCIIP